MFFTSATWLIGGAMSLESMRRSFIGGTSLALFIDLSGLDQLSCLRDTDILRLYLPIEEMLIQDLPFFLKWMASPWIDHHKAASTFLTIADTICANRAIETLEITKCEDVWELL